MYEMLNMGKFLSSDLPNADNFQAVNFFEYLCFYAVRIWTQPPSISRPQLFFFPDIVLSVHFVPTAIPRFFSLVFRFNNSTAVYEWVQ